MHAHCSAGHLPNTMGGLGRHGSETNTAGSGKRIDGLEAWLALTEQQSNRLEEGMSLSKCLQAFQPFFAPVKYRFGGMPQAT